jgi:adenosine/AMP kinase
VLVSAVILLRFNKHNISISKHASMCLVLEHLHYPINHSFPINRTVEVANVYSTQANPRHFNLITIQKDIETCRANIYATARKFEQKLYYREDI